MTPSRVPTGTYRLQLQPAFGFREAAEAVPHLASLGVGHLHLSPILQAVPGSAHGYDVVDHSRISRDLGGEEGFRSLAATAARHGLGIVLDIVPNHMALPAPESLNRPLWHTLAEGPESPSAVWFDIDWAVHDGRILLPFLDGPPERVRDELIVDGDVLRYHDHVFPLRPGTEKLALPELLDRQHYLLADWRTGDASLNYRRFFTITTLIGLRQEDPDVFGATHEVVLRLLDEGLVQGLRVDHVDGLADPRGYLRRLRTAAPGAWIVVEKILTGNEEPPADWPCDGTTGYDALRRVDGVFVDPDGAEPLRALHREQTGAAVAGFPVVAQKARAEVLCDGLAAEVSRLGRAADAAGIVAGDRDDALRALLTAFPAYRPYPGTDGSAAPASVAMMAEALTSVPGRRAVTARVLAEAALRPGVFATRFGQVASAVAAKGVEDRAFYRWHVLPSLGEVGGEPDDIGLAPDAFHAFCARMRPTTMTTLSTHDTKRGEDVRARLAVLAEMPGRWAERVREWNARAERHRTGPGPGPYDTYLLWWTLIGSWPIAADRVCRYMRKAMREAACATSWTAPDPAYEESSERFFRAVLADGGLCASVTEFAGLLADPARAVSLGAKLVQLTMPGVPDVYQGGERTLYTLVDPDNRAPVDPAAHGPLPTSPGPDLDTAKAHVTACALRLRRSRPEVFAGAYTPMTARGTAAAHAIAFLRGGEALTVATRLPASLAAKGGWGGTLLPLPEGEWTNLLTGRRHAGQARLRHVLADSPVALLVRV